VCCLGSGLYDEQITGSGYSYQAYVCVSKLCVNEIPKKRVAIGQIWPVVLLKI